MVSKLHKDNKGFTIIEVLIVLAIAGLIMLIVFLAVPALQRNQRNNARNNDAARVSAAVTECLANRNGIVTSCDDQAEIDAGTLSRLETVSFGAEAFSQTDARVVYNAQCNPDGTASAAGGGTRAFAVTYQLEGGASGINRCIAS
jgi:prepilin-type N-terminal cleavage/methylation domain-containing protein